MEDKTGMGMDLLRAMKEGLFTRQPEEEVVAQSVEILRLQPGDMLVYTNPNWLPKHTLDAVQEKLLKMIPKGVNIAILDGGARFSVVRQEEIPNAVNS